MLMAFALGHRPRRCSKDWVHLRDAARTATARTNFVIPTPFGVSWTTGWWNAQSRWARQFTCATKRSPAFGHGYRMPIRTLSTFVGFSSPACSELQSIWTMNATSMLQFSSVAGGMHSCNSALRKGPWRTVVWQLSSFRSDHTPVVSSAEDGEVGTGMSPLRSLRSWR